MALDIQGLLYRTDTDQEPGIAACGGVGGRATLTISVRQHVYTTAEKHSSIFKLLLISFTRSLELMNPRDP